IILISSDSTISLESSSSDATMSSKGSSKALLKWYKDAMNKDIKEFMFSKSGVRKPESCADKAKRKRKVLRWKLMKAFHHFV
ncbi:hypothetical protein Tco_1559939, partial [Tanacetum coccineum]